TGAGGAANAADWTPADAGVQGAQMISLNPEAIDLATLRQLWEGAPAKLDDASMTRTRASAASVERIVAGGETVYGVNTGFGLLANTRIPPERLPAPQTHLH